MVFDFSFVPQTRISGLVNVVVRSAAETLTPKSGGLQER